MFLLLIFQEVQSLKRDKFKNKKALFYKGEIGKQVKRPLPLIIPQIKFRHKPAVGLS